MLYNNNNNNKLTLQRRTINESYVTKAPVATTKTEPNIYTYIQLPVY